MPKIKDPQLVAMLIDAKLYNDWERGFAADLLEQLAQSKGRFKLTVKQRKHVVDILFVPNRAHIAKKRKEEQIKRVAAQARRYELDAKLEASKLERVFGANY